MTDIMASLPFDGVHDQDLAVAYTGSFCAIFYVCFVRILFYNAELRHKVTLFTCGRNLIQHDFIGPDIDDGECDGSQSSTDAEPPIIPKFTENPSANQPRPAMRCANFLCNLVSPVLLSAVVSFIVSRISALKALFIPNVSGTNIPPAPDGQPPLAFIMDTVAFLGAANSPIELIILGSALARMNIHRGRSLPLGAIGALAVCKQLIMPVSGILICEGFTRVGFIDAEDKVLRCVCTSFVSCLPIALTQVILTQAWSDTSTTDHLVAFLLPQLILLPGVMTVLTAFTLELLFDYMATSGCECCTERID
ncbi:hypothetical protein EDB19DRAFT_1107932 [Suillus lakei]|nr:hypothetical protein EDB19DRAFT_1107932 [Suillus lakei]